MNIIDESTALDMAALRLIAAIALRTFPEYAHLTLTEALNTLDKIIESMVATDEKQRNG